MKRTHEKDQWDILTECKFQRHQRNPPGSVTLAPQLVKHK